MGLQRVSTLQEYRYPEYAYDVRGWTVRTERDGRKVGTVDDVIVTEAGEPRYLDVDMGFLKKHVLVPLDRAFTESADRVVIVEGLEASAFEDIPAFRREPGELTLDYERRLADAYGGIHGRRPVAAEPERDERFVRLDEMRDFRVKGDEDPRGWKIVSGDGNVLGKAVDLLIDRDTMRAGYLLAAIDEKKLDLERIGRHVLVPIERVRLTDDKRVLLDGLFARDVARYPVYAGVPVERDLLDRIGGFFDRLLGEDAAGVDVTAGSPAYYPTRHPRKFFGTTTVPAAPATESVTHFDEGGPVGVIDAGHAYPDTVESDAVTLREGDTAVRVVLRGGDIIIERRGPGADPDATVVRVDEPPAARADDAEEDIAVIGDRRLEEPPLRS